MAGSSPNGQKTLWEKEKLLVMSNFSFSRSVFKGFLLQTRNLFPPPPPPPGPLTETSLLYKDKHADGQTG